MSFDFNILRDVNERFVEYPLFIQIALVTIVLSISIVILTGISIISQRLVYAVFELRIHKARNIVARLLSNKLMLEDDVTELDIDKLADRLKGLSLKDKIYNQVVIDLLIFYHHNFSGSTGGGLYKLYNKMQLTDTSLGKLKNGPWDVKAKSLRKLQEMPPSQKSLTFLSPMLLSKNNDLRIEAQAAYLRLSKDSPFNFLDTANEELLDWHQIILFDIIANTEDLKVPDFKKWLSSLNVSVVIFSIKLIVQYQQLDAIPKLIRLLNHSSTKIKVLAVYALGRLDAKNSEHVLVAIYPTQPLRVKLKIIETLGIIRSGECIAFLTDLFLHSKEFSLIKSAGCALTSHHNFDKSLVFKSIELSSQRVTIMNHCTNTLIRT